ncbi:MAG: hypothetical protein DI570_32340, partial [Phenylobacterium zucineum]
MKTNVSTGDLAYVTGPLNGLQGRVVLVGARAYDGEPHPERPGMRVRSWGESVLWWITSASGGELLPGWKATPMTDRYLRRIAGPGLDEVVS